MKRWGYTVAVLYALVLVIAMPPLYLAAFAPTISFARALDSWSDWQFWALIALLFAAQALFLLLPVRVASRRPVSRMTILVPLLVSGLMAALLAVGVACSLLEFAYGPHTPQLWQLVPLCAGLVAWAAWGLYFWRASASRSGEDVVRAQCRALVKGSVLELLIAVPTHVVARYRDYCCAGLMTFVGLACGIAVMLFAFGPGVFFLYVERWRRLHPDAGPGGPAAPPAT
jgi:hypothetical protein